MMTAFMVFAVPFILGAALILWAILIYNRLVAQSKRRDEAWSGVLVQLKRRHDLVPNLVGAVEGYAIHEKNVLEEVSRMRAFGYSGGPREVGKAEAAFSGALANLLAIAENYPTLKADANFRELQNSLVQIEDDIQMARRYYNGAVRDYNTSASTFPGLLVARRHSFRESLFFDLDSPSDAIAPKVSFAGK